MSSSVKNVTKVSALIEYAEVCCQLGSETESTSRSDGDSVLLRVSASESARAILEMMPHCLFDCGRLSTIANSDETEEHKEEEMEDDDDDDDEEEEREGEGEEVRKQYVRKYKLRKKEVRKVLSLVPLRCLVTVAKAEAKTFCVRGKREFEIRVCSKTSSVLSGDNSPAHTSAVLLSRLMLILQVIALSVHEGWTENSAIQEELITLCCDLIRDARFVPEELFVNKNTQKGKMEVATVLDEYRVDYEEPSITTVDIAMMVVGKKRGRREEMAHEALPPTRLPCLPMEVAEYCTSIFSNYTPFVFNHIVANDGIISVVCEFIHRQLRRIEYGGVREDEFNSSEDDTEAVVGSCEFEASGSNDGQARESAPCTSEAPLHSKRVHVNMSKRLRAESEVDDSFLLEDPNFVFVFKNVMLFLLRFCLQLVSRDSPVSIAIEKALGSLMPVLLLFRRIIRGADLMRRPKCVVKGAFTMIFLVLELICKQGDVGTQILLHLGFADELFHLTRLRREDELPPWHRCRKVSANSQLAEKEAIMCCIVPRRSVACEQLAAVMSFLPTDELVRVCALSKDVFVNVVDANEHLHLPLRTYCLNESEESKRLGVSILSVLGKLFGVAVKIADTDEPRSAKVGARWRLLSDWELILTLYEQVLSAGSLCWDQSQQVDIVTIVNLLCSCKSYHPAERAAIAERITQSPKLMDAICNGLACGQGEKAEAEATGLAVVLSLCKLLLSADFLLSCKPTSNVVLLSCVALFLKAVASEATSRGLMTPARMARTTKNEAIEAFSRLALDVFPLYREVFSSLNPYRNRNELSTAVGGKETNIGASSNGEEGSAPAGLVRTSLECKETRQILKQIVENVLDSDSTDDLQSLLMAYRFFLETRAACLQSIDDCLARNERSYDTEDLDTESSEWPPLNYTITHALERGDTLLNFAEISYYFFERTCEELAVKARRWVRR